MAIPPPSFSVLPFVTVTTPAAAEPYEFATLTAFVKQETADDTDLTRLAKVAREYIEEQTGRVMMTQTLKLTCDAWPDFRLDDGKLVLPRTPLTSVTSVKYMPADGGAQATLVAGTDYRVIIPGNDRPGWVELIDGKDWPDIAVRSDAIEVVFVAGFADAASVKHQLVQAIFFLTKHLYDNARDVVAVGNIVNEIPFGLRDFITSQRVGGWFA